MEYATFMKKALRGLPCLIVIMILTLHGVGADVIAVTKDNMTYTYPSMPAQFGQGIPPGGIMGMLVVADPISGCRLPQPAPRSNTSTNIMYFALMRRYDCNFDEKVLNAQNMDYDGAIIYNVGSDDVLSMGGGDFASQVIIASVFVGETAGLSLQLLNYTTGTTVNLTPYLKFPISYFLLPFLVVTSTCLLFCCIYSVAKFFRDRRRKQRARMSRANLKKIPIKKFVKGDDYDVCAICLDDYEQGDKLRILPCNHAFHCKCVDPWLINNRRTCPVCKRKVVPSGMADSDESDSEDDSHGGGNPTEHTPLLGASTPAAPSEDQEGGAAAVTNGAWGGPKDGEGGEESHVIVLVDASTALRENEVSDEDATLPLTNHPINAIVQATPTPSPGPLEEAALPEICFIDEENTEKDYQL